MPGAVRTQPRGQVQWPGPWTMGTVLKDMYWGRVTEMEERMPSCKLRVLSSTGVWRICRAPVGRQARIQTVSSMAMALPREQRATKWGGT